VVCCSSVSNLVYKVSTIAVNLVMRVVRSAVISSAISGYSDSVGGDDATKVGRRTGGVVEEDRLDHDTRLSRASTPKTAGPRLRSS
jgi:hypothetical protein